MDEKRIRGHLVDGDTGQITTDLYEGDRIVRDGSIKHLRQTKGKAQALLEWNLEHFLKAHIPELKLWIKDLSQAEKAFLFSIQPYISYEDCHLQHGNGVDIGTEDLMKITGMSRPAVYKVIDSLVDKDILYRGRNSKNRQYFVNPWLFCKGNRINKVLRTMFKNYKIRVLGNVRWKDVK
jgi:DNA-binding MarR family transcriptional regulator